MGMLQWVSPLIPSFARIAGALLPLAPLFTAIGTALYFVTPVLQAFGSFLDLLPGSLLSSSVASQGLGAALSTLGPIIAAVGYVVAGIIAWWDELVEIWNLTVGPAINTLMSAFGDLGSAIGVSVDWMQLLKYATWPVYAALSALMMIVSSVIHHVAELVRWIAFLERKFHFIRDTINLVNGAFSGFNSALSSGIRGVADFISRVCIPHTMMDIFEKTNMATRSLQGFHEELRRTEAGIMRVTSGVSIGMRIPSTAGGTQYVTISAPITIESISSSMDLDEVTDAITDAISDALRRARR